MKKFLKFLILLAVVAAVVAVVWYSKTLKNNEKVVEANSVEVENKVKEINEINKTKEVKMKKNNYVSYNGKLKLDGTNIVNQYGEKFQMRGISSHGIQWFSQFANENSLKYLKNNFEANVFRIAMYTEENGYIQNNNLKDKVKEIIEIAKKQDMYVIIDWHILSDNNPNKHINEAKAFFDEMSKEYAEVPNVIYEICNEPNGNTEWNKDIKPYAEQVIGTIRNNSKDSLIIVGTGFWCQKVEDAASNKIIDYNNILYACHFYSGTHKEDLRNQVQNAINSGLPIIVSECGISAADGNGGIFKEEATKWFEFLNKNNISWIVWSWADKNETSALLKPGTDPQNITDNSLTEAGIYIKEKMLEK